MSRRSKLVLAAVLIAAAAAGLSVAAVALLGDESGGQSFVIVGDEEIGGFPRDGTVADAIEVFGAPTSRRSVFPQCTLIWERLGITMTTYLPLREHDPCGPTGRHQSTTVTDQRWRTSDGLRIGDSVAGLERLYPDVQEFQGSYELRTRPAAGVPLVSLEANVESGQIVSFTVYGERLV